VLAFYKSARFCFSTVIALAESRSDLGKRWPSRLVATAEEKRLNLLRNTHVVCGSSDW
jgi:hypothetical protein